MPLNLVLIPLYNAGFDFAKLDADGRYRGHGKKRATHKLVCTRQNTDMNYIHIQHRLRTGRQRPEGYALAVCAIPLRRRVRKVKLRLNKPAPTDRIAYRQDGSLAGKRVVLAALVPKLKAKIKFYGNAQCDAFYKSILWTNKIARRREARRLRRLKRLGL